MSFCNKSLGQRLSLSANVTFVGFHVKCYKCIDVSALKVRKVPSLHLTLTACILRQIYIDCPLGAKTRNYSVTITGFLPAKNMYLMLSVVIYDRCLKKIVVLFADIFCLGDRRISQGSFFIPPFFLFWRTTNRWCQRLVNKDWTSRCLSFFIWWSSKDLLSLYM